MNITNFLDLFVQFQLEEFTQEVSDIQTVFVAYYDVAFTERLLRYIHKNGMTKFTRKVLFDDKFFTPDKRYQVSMEIDFERRIIDIAYEVYSQWEINNDSILMLINLIQGIFLGYQINRNPHINELSYYGGV